VHDHMIYIQPAGMSRYDIIMWQKPEKDSIRTTAT
jgi:hypothetical protein